MKPNLSSLSDNEINSGKIWTLLRYNKAFQKDVKWFAAKYKTATNKRAKQETRENAKEKGTYKVLITNDYGSVFSDEVEVIVKR